MGQLMRQQPLSTLGSRIVLSCGKRYVTPECESPGLYAGRRRGGVRPLVNTHIAKVMAEARLEEAATGWIERHSNAEATGEVGSGFARAGLASCRALYPRLLCVPRARGGCVRTLRIGTGIGHAHHLLGHRIGLAFEGIAGLADREPWLRTRCGRAVGTTSAAGAFPAEATRRGQRRFRDRCRSVSRQCGALARAGGIGEDRHLLTPMILAAEANASLGDRPRYDLVRPTTQSSIKPSRTLICPV